MKRVLVCIGVLSGCLAALPAGAQQFLGRVGAQCSTPVTTLGFPIALSANVAGGQTLIVGVGVSSTFVSGLRISDPIGTHYDVLAGAKAGGVGSVVYFRGALQRGLSLGQTLQLSLDSVGSDITVCADIQAYSGIAFGRVVQESFGASGGPSNLVMLTADRGAVTPTRKLVLGAVASMGDPGTISPSGTVSALPVLCSGSQPFCLVEAWSFEDPSSAPEITLGLANTVTWRGVVTSIEADGIFGNGFD